MKCQSYDRYTFLLFRPFELRAKTPARFLKRCKTREIERSTVEASGTGAERKLAKLNRQKEVDKKRSVVYGQIYNRFPAPKRHRLQSAPLPLEVGAARSGMAPASQRPTKDFANRDAILPDVPVDRL